MLARSYRSYAWVQALGGARRGSGRSTELVDRADTAQAALEAESASWSLTVPAQELRAAERDATVAGRRLLLVGGEAAALLVAFAVLAAGASGATSPPRVAASRGTALAVGRVRS